MNKGVFKKLTASVLAGAMMFSLAACGGGGTGDGASESATTEITGAFLGQIDAWPTYQGGMDGTADKYGQHDLF